MADFRTRLITFAGVATVFAGIAYGQPATVTADGANAVFVRAEGTTELVAPSTVTITNNSGAQASVNITVYLSPSVAVTSESSSNAPKSETVATGGVAPVTGVVSGSTVTFTAVLVPTGGATVITISNIRINASTIAVASGVPTGVTETFFVGGTGITPDVPAPVTVAYALNGLGTVKASNTVAGGNQICGAVLITNLNFTVSVTEGFATSFRTMADESGTVGALPATQGTRFTITFANVPANVSVYVPLTVTAAMSGGITAAVTLVNSATGAFAAAPDAMAKNEPPPPAIGLGAVAIANGTGTAVYEVTTDNQGAVDTFPVNVYLASGAGVVPAPSGAITATVSLAPIGAAADYPSFVSGSSTTTVSGSTFTACSTTLLFPFVTNQLGFDTGLAIANTSTDLLGVNKGVAIDSVNAQSGTCLLTFFGANAPAAGVTTSIVATGTAWTGAASTLAPGFQGYTIAQCNFQYAHGFAYVVYNLTQNNGAAMGYLGLVINGNRAATEALEN